MWSQSCAHSWQYRPFARCRAGHTGALSGCVLPVLDQLVCQATKYCRKQTTPLGGKGWPLTTGFIVFSKYPSLDYTQPPGDTLQSAWLESQPTKTQHVNTFIKLGVSQEPGSVPHSISTCNEARGRAGGWGSTRLLGPQKSALSSSCNPVHLLIKHGPQRKSGTFLTLRLPTLSRCRVLFANRLCRLASIGLQQMHPSCHLAQ